MTTHQKIRKALDLTYLVYDNYRSSCYETYCAKYSRDFALPLRVLVTHDTLYNWYCHQWNVYVEEAFYRDYKDFLEAGIEDPENNLQGIFMSYPADIEKFYPKPIINLIKKANKLNDTTRVNKV